MRGSGVITRSPAPFETSTTILIHGRTSIAKLLDLNFYNTLKCLVQVYMSAKRVTYITYNQGLDAKKLHLGNLVHNSRAPQSFEPYVEVAYTE